MKYRLPDFISGFVVGLIAALVPLKLSGPTEAPEDSSDEKLIELEKMVLTSFKEEHSRVETRYRALDTKAQATAGIAGIFLAAIFAFIRSVNTAMPFWEFALVVASLISLVLSISTAVLAMRIYRVTAPPQGIFVRHVVDQRVKRDWPEGADLPLLGLFNAQSSKWAMTIESLEEAVAHKALKVRISQWLLVLATGSVAAATVVQMSIDL